jgi:HEAT repeat protein
MMTRSKNLFVCKLINISFQLFIFLTTILLFNYPLQNTHAQEIDNPADTPITKNDSQVEISELIKQLSYTDKFDDAKRILVENYGQQAILPLILELEQVPGREHQKNISKVLVEIGLKLGSSYVPQKQVSYKIAERLSGSKNASEPKVRENLAIFIGLMSVKAQKEEVNALYKAYIDDPNENVSKTAELSLKNLGRAAKTLIPELEKLLNDNDRELNDRYKKQRAALEILGNIGNITDIPAVTFIQLLKGSEDREVRQRAANALGKISINQTDTVKALIQALNDQDDPRYEVRYNAAYALGRVEVDKAVDALPKLNQLLKEAPPIAKVYFAYSVGQIATGGADIENINESLENLNDLCKDDLHSYVRRHAADALANIAVGLSAQNKKNNFKSSDLRRIIQKLDSVLSALKNIPNNQLFSPQIEAIQLARMKLAEPQINGWEFMNQNPIPIATVIAIIVYLIGIPCIWGIILLLNPILLFKLDKTLSQNPVVLPLFGGLGDPIVISLRDLLFLRFFAYRLRVLDAWVESTLPTVRKAFNNKETVDYRQVHIPIPVDLDNKIAKLTPQLLKSIFHEKRFCLLIRGEGGLGKTSIACEIAKWSMSEDINKNLCSHRMLPVLIEQELNGSEQKPHEVLKLAIQGYIQDVTQEESISDEFLRELLKNRRILVIIDHFSEMSLITRDKIHPELAHFPINALVITSRTKETLGGVNRNTLIPQSIEGNQLRSFIDEYLKQKQKLNLLNNINLNIDYVVNRLQQIVGSQKNVTVMLAKLYVEYLISQQKGWSKTTYIRNIPDLMLAYLKELNRNVAKEKMIDNEQVRHYAKIVAWECLKDTFHPTDTNRSSILKSLSNNQLEAREWLRYLEQSLHLIHSINPEDNQIRFNLHPLCEYLAALHITEKYDNNESQWSDFWNQSRTKSSNIQTIKGFLLAVQDCCRARGINLEIPNDISKELGIRDDYLSDSFPTK